LTESLAAIVNLFCVVISTPIQVVAATDIEVHKACRIVSVFAREDDGV
jgi:hypothetical protein